MDHPLSLPKGSFYTYMNMLLVFHTMQLLNANAGKSKQQSPTPDLVWLLCAQTHQVDDNTWIAICMPTNRYSLAVAASRCLLLLIVHLALSMELSNEQHSFTTLALLPQAFYHYLSTKSVTLGCFAPDPNKGALHPVPQVLFAPKQLTLAPPLIRRISLTCEKRHKHRCIFKIQHPHCSFSCYSFLYLILC